MQSLHIDAQLSQARGDVVQHCKHHHIVASLHPYPGTQSSLCLHWHRTTRLQAGAYLVLPDQTALCPRARGECRRRACSGPGEALRPALLCTGRTRALCPPDHHAQVLRACSGLHPGGTADRQGGACLARERQDASAHLQAQALGCEGLDLPLEMPSGAERVHVIALCSQGLAHN